jgi:hypothetical protein
MPTLYGAAVINLCALQTKKVYDSIHRTVGHIKHENIKQIMDKVVPVVLFVPYTTRVVDQD